MSRYTLTKTQVNNRQELVCMDINSVVVSQETVKGTQRIGFGVCILLNQFRKVG